MNGIIRCTLVVGLGVGIALAGSAATAAAQGTGAAGTSQPFGAIDGTVVDSAGHGIPGVEIFLFGARRGAHTSAAGAYRIDSVGTGLHIVRFRRLGLRPTTLTVSVAPNDITGIDVVMPVMPQQLQTVLIQNANGDVLQLPKGFAERVKYGMGSYFTADDIERLHPIRTSDILHGVAGVLVSASGTVSVFRGPVSLPLPARESDEGRGHVSEHVYSKPTADGCGAIPAYLDGTLMSDQSDIDLITPRDLAGIEVYKSGVTMPLAFVRPSPCGAILLWTK